MKTHSALQGQRPDSIPALGNAQGRVPPAERGLKARHQIVRKPDSRWFGLSALVMFLLPNLGRRSCLALAQADMEPGLRPSIATFGMKTLVLASIALVAALALSGCGPAEAKTHEQPPENGAQYKKDKGVALPTR